jgi:predicted extracellular nuclease
MKTFVSVSGLVDSDVAAGIPAVERYTYRFDMNSQALDHIFVSPAMQRKAKVEHLHLSTWAAEEDVVSDHDPSVGLFNVCSC